jgi:hypothetical protein
MGSKAGGPMSQAFTACQRTLGSMIEMLHQQNSRAFPATSSLLDVSVAALVDESGVSEFRLGCTIGQKLQAVLGTIRSTPPSNSNQQFRIF